MYINNYLRDLIFHNNLLHGFWDNVRTYEAFVENVFGEFEEVLEELRDHDPTEVYTKDGIKPEGVPTELADIVIFILDYFGGSNPQIDVDEKYLLTEDKYYKNLEYYEKARNKSAIKYFNDVYKECQAHLSKSLYYHVIHQNKVFIDEDGNKKGVPLELHFVIKRILEVCDVFKIDFERELRAKIAFNNSRPKDYRKIGSTELLNTDRDSVYSEMLKSGFGMYKDVDKIVAFREKINEDVIAKRNARADEEDSVKR